MSRRILVVIAAAMLSAGAALANGGTDEGPKGVAVVIAPESGVYTCAAGNPDAAFACARKKCRDAGEADCYRTNWCYPGRWGAVYSVRTAEFHGPDALCGAPTREAVLATVVCWCRAQEHVVSCFVSTILTPEGGEEPIEEEFTFDR